MSPAAFYVNSACIDCDTCRQLAPTVFTQVGGYSAVTKQPEGRDEERLAFGALLACPTGAIGSETKEGIALAAEDFPLLLNENVYYCGYTSAHLEAGRMAGALEELLRRMKQGDSRLYV